MRICDKCHNPCVSFSRTAHETSRINDDQGVEITITLIGKGNEYCEGCMSDAAVTAISEIVGFLKIKKEEDNERKSE